MGYESKFYIVEKEKFDLFKEEIDNKEMIYARKIAMFDMSKIGNNAMNRIMEYPKTNAFIYADDGETMIVEDRYGDELIEIPIDDMIDIIAEEMKDNAYRRYAPFYGLLTSFNMNEWGNLVVLHYGY